MSGRLYRADCGDNRHEPCRQADIAVQVFLETERLVLRRFTTGDVDNLVGLDADPDVMRFVSGGIPTSRDEIENEFLPAFLGYYQRYQAYGFWAAIEKSTGDFLGWFHFRPRGGNRPGPGRARLPDAQVSLGQGIRHRRVARADPQRLRRLQRTACDRRSDGREYGLPARDGERGRRSCGPSVSPGLTRPAATR